MMEPFFIDQLKSLYYKEVTQQVYKKTQYNNNTPANQSALQNVKNSTTIENGITTQFSGAFV